MTEEDKNKARGLAVSYEAFWSAVHEAETAPGVRKVWNSVWAWARMLQLAQRDIEIELMTDAALSTHLERATRKMAEIDALALEAEPIVTNR